MYVGDTVIMVGTVYARESVCTFEYNFYLVCNTWSALWLMLTFGDLLYFIWYSFLILLVNYFIVPVSLRCHFLCKNFVTTKFADTWFVCYIWLCMFCIYPKDKTVQLSVSTNAYFYVHHSFQYLTSWYIFCHKWILSFSSSACGLVVIAV